MTKFILFMNLDMVIEIQLQNSSLALFDKVADAHVNTCCKLKLVFLEKRL